MDTHPITPEGFAPLIAPYVVAGERVAVAVSGGPDSMALAFCLMRHLGPERLTALIVEHGLRAESADEAKTVAGRLASLGIETEILPWVHGEVKSGVHVKARSARYGLLIDACKRRGIDKLFLAHHANDQAETVLMRFAKGSGIDGLAGMDAVTTMDGVHLIRPLLHVPKASLLETCRANDIAYVVDPSNEAKKYARGRLRRVMPLLEEEGFTADRLLDLADRAHDAKEALDFYTLDFLRRFVEPLSGGAARLDLVALRGVPVAVAQRAVSTILTDIHQSSYAPERKHLVPFVVWLLDQDIHDARTLHGCLVQKGEQCAKATFLREPEGVTDSQELLPNQTILWDGRWEVASSHTQPVVVRALGRQSHEQTDQLSPRLRHQIPQGRIRSTLPALWQADKLMSLPAFTKEDQGVVRAVCRPFSWLQTTG